MVSLIRYLTLVALFLIYSIYASHPYLKMGLGAGFSKIGESQYYEPFQNVVNFYEHNNKTTFVSPVISIEFGYLFDINNELYLSTGLEGNFISYGRYSGIEHPLVNIPIQFDTLSYSYSVESHVLDLRSEIGYKNKVFFPYVFLGLGVSFNEISDYQVVPNGSAAPSIQLYKNNTDRSISYTLGIGLLRYALDNGISLSVEYKFLYNGTGSLKGFLGNKKSLGSGIITGNFITLNFIFK